LVPGFRSLRSLETLLFKKYPGPLVVPGVSVASDHPTLQQPNHLTANNWLIFSLKSSKILKFFVLNFLKLNYFLFFDFFSRFCEQNFDKIENIILCDFKFCVIIRRIIFHSKLFLFPHPLLKQTISKQPFPSSLFLPPSKYLTIPH
jgi:hypothetical protein